MDKFKEFIESARVNQRRLMEEASNVVMNRPIPGDDPTSKRAAMLPELETDDDD